MFTGSKPGIHYVRLERWFSNWGLQPPGGREPFLEGSRVDILCAQLHYIYFIRVIDGVGGLQLVVIMGRWGSLGYSWLL